MMNTGLRTHGSRPGERALARLFDVALLDLDGVVYRGQAAVDGAVAALADARAAGMRLAFVTNNASRSPSAIAAQLSSLGVPTTSSDVVTSAQAAAFAKTNEGIENALKRWLEIKTNDLPAVNRQLGVAGLTELRLDLAPEQEASGENEE